MQQSLQKNQTNVFSYDFLIAFHFLVGLDMGALWTLAT